MEQHATHDLRKPTAALRRAGRGVTMPELLVVIGIIVVLMAILLPALRAVRAQALTTSSMNNLRQIATFMRAYERENRDTIVPSQFDYSGAVFTHKGKVRMDVGVAPKTGEWHKGSWADILWTINELGVFPAATADLGHDYRYMAPDKALYDVISGTIPNPLRAAMMNTKDSLGDGDPKPHGDPAKSGAHEVGYPGFFAANNFFNASPDAPDYDGAKTPVAGRWWSAAQIIAPERSMHLVDSFYGEVIEPIAQSFENTPGPGGMRPIEVDFRHSSAALMLMLDGSIRPEGPWQTLADLEEQRSIRIRELDKHAPN